jgi:hypothetical protein
MQLAGRLRSTTLGDLLGALHRGASSGTLELATDQGRTHRVHLARGLVTAVELDGASPSLAEMLRQGRVADEDVLRRSLLRAMASQRLHGEVLIDDFHLAPSVIGEALRRQVKARLGAIDQLADARVSFRVAVRPPRGALLGAVLGSPLPNAQGTGSHVPWNAPLTPPEFLTGRRRARPRAPSSPASAGSRGGRGSASSRATDGSDEMSSAASAGDESVWRTLGLSPGVTLTEVKRAYRRLARTVHPDLHPDATAGERRSLEVRFMEITRAYDALVALDSASLQSRRTG